MHRRMADSATNNENRYTLGELQNINTLNGYCSKNIKLYEKQGLIG